MIAHLVDRTYELFRLTRLQVRDPRQRVTTTSCARSPPQSLGEDAQAECKETPRKPRKRLRPTRSREKMASDRARCLAPHPGDAGGGGTIHESAGDGTDVDRESGCDVLERAEASAALP